MNINKFIKASIGFVIICFILIAGYFLAEAINDLRNFMTLNKECERVATYTFTECLTMPELEKKIIIENEFNQ